MARQTQTRETQTSATQEAPLAAHPLPSEGGSFMWVDGVLTRVEEAPEAPVETHVEGAV